jgi:hypothetical protein
MTQLRVTAKDSAGQAATAVFIPVYVDSSIRLRAAAEVTGVIWDVDPDRILHMQSMADRGILKIHQRSGGQDSVVIDQTGMYPQYGYLTPKGAIFVEQNGNSTTSRLYEKRGDDLLELVSTNSNNESLRSTSLVVKSPYAIWNQGGALILRELP